MKKLIYYFMFCQLMVFCTRPDELIDVDFEEGSPHIASIEAIERMGFDVSDILILEDGYVVEGDIFITEENIAEIEAGANEPNSRQTYYGDTKKISLPADGSTRNIYVYIDPTMTGEYYGFTWIHLVRLAVDKLNGVSNLNVKFYTTSSASQADITIRRRRNTSYFSKTSVPSGGNPGSEIEIHNEYHKGEYQHPYAKVMQIVHLICHAVGMGHTESTVLGSEPTLPLEVPDREIYLPGTPWHDNNSVMIRGNIGAIFTRFTAGDVFALRTLLSNNPPTAPDPSITGPATFVAGKEVVFEMKDVPGDFNTAGFEFPGADVTIVSSTNSSVKVKFNRDGNFTVKAKMTSRIAPVTTRYIEKRVRVDKPSRINWSGSEIVLGHWTSQGVLDKVLFEFKSNFDTRQHGPITFESVTWEVLGGPHEIPPTGSILDQGLSKTITLAENTNYTIKVTAEWACDNNPNTYRATATLPYRIPIPLPHPSGHIRVLGPRTVYPGVNQAFRIQPLVPTAFKSFYWRADDSVDIKVGGLWSYKKFSQTGRHTLNFYSKNHGADVPWYLTTIQVNVVREDRPYIVNYMKQQVHTGDTLVISDMSFAPFFNGDYCTDGDFEWQISGSPAATIKSYGYMGKGISVDFGDGGTYTVRMRQIRPLQTAWTTVTVYTHPAWIDDYPGPDYDWGDGNP